MTAVEYLVQQICGEHTEAWIEEIQQALEMEKEQIIGSYCDGRLSVINKQIILAEQYYNETYKKDLK
jgi:hypothetical protein